MEAKTKNEVEVLRLSRTLPELTPKQSDWFFNKAFANHIFVRRYKSTTAAWCSKCGHRWHPSGNNFILDNEQMECPKCHTVAKTEFSNCETFGKNDKWYCSVIDRAGKFQVIRNFIAERFCKKGHAEERIIRECVQNWLPEHGKIIVMARSTAIYNFYGCYDNWDWLSELKLKSAHNLLWNSKYNIYAKFIYPRKKILPVLKRNGFKGSFHNIAPLNLFYNLLNNNKFETLFKAKYYKACDYVLEYGRQLDDVYWNALKICMRNHYVADNWHDYKDYIDLLQYFQLDLHSPHYLCPECFDDAHTKLFRKKEAIETAKNEAEIMRRSARLDKAYKKAKSKFFGVVISDDNLDIRPLQSVAEFYQEGHSMHHCVFACEYYNRKNSLILSARDKESGEREETIELDLRTFKVVQSRGHCNNDSPYHKEIISLVENNVQAFRKCVNN